MNIKQNDWHLLPPEDYDKVFDALSQKYPKLFIRDKSFIFKKGIHRDIFNNGGLDFNRTVIRKFLQLCIEKKEYTADYLDPNKRSIANAIQIFYKDGNKSELIEVEYPIGHQRRRAEGIPKLIEKFKVNLSRQFDEVQLKKILEKSLNYEILEQIPVNEYMDLYWKN